jgi:hypothetical protein
LLNNNEEQTFTQSVLIRLDDVNQIARPGLRDKKCLEISRQIVHLHTLQAWFKQDREVGEFSKNKCVHCTLAVGMALNIIFSINTHLSTFD